MQQNRRMDLKTWRTEHNLSQGQLARLLEVDQMTISRWESGHIKKAAPGKLLQLALERLDEVLAQQKGS